MKFIIGNDIHLGSKHATHTWDELKALVWGQLQTSKKIVLNGDIIDMANVPKKEVQNWKYRLETIAAMCASHGAVFIRGNHSLNQVEAPDWAIIDGVFFTHGDMFNLLWDEQKSKEYRAKKPGAGFLKRAITPLYDNLRHLKPWKPSERFYKAVDKIIDAHKPKAIVLGHTHPPSNIDFMYKGVRILILKRGIQEINI